MTEAAGFRSRYAAALRTYLEEQGEASLEVGQELGRRALREKVSTLDIVETHFRLVDEALDGNHIDHSAALQFLLQTLAPLDVATRGFLDGTRRYEQERARAEDLADRDEFRTALVNALQEGFFVVGHEGEVVEINDAFSEITGYGTDGLPYQWPHPWVVDDKSVGERLAEAFEVGKVQSEIQIRHRDGHLVWTALSINAVTADGDDRGAYVGTVRDITMARASAARDNAVMRLATAAGVAKSVAEVLAILLDELRTAIDLRRVLAIIWPKNEGEPAIKVARASFQTTWRELDPLLRQTLENARHWSPLTVEPVASVDYPGRSSGIIAILSGGVDTALWLEHDPPRRTSADDRLLISALVGHLSLAMQHVRQFENAREASLTLQRAMLPTTKPPAGFAVRYEPAVAPFEIGGDWYDVLPVRDDQIGIIVGDCVGRGLPAAAVMGQLRSSARALLLTGAEPALLLESLDSAAEFIPGAYCATVFLAILDLESGGLRYSSAGHVPGVLASPQSQSTLLTGAGSVPIGVKRTEPRPQTTQVLPPGSTLMLFTDGLVERRDDTIDAGIGRVTKVLIDTLGAPADAVADAALGELAPPEGYEDDVAIVVYRRPPGPLQIEVPATAEQLRNVRGELTAWLKAVGATEPLLADIVLGVNEACTNSAEHAYRRVGPGTMRVESEFADAEIRVSVLDFGTWKTPDPNPGTRGRGLAIVRAVSDRVEVDGTAEGTTVAMTFVMPET